MNEVTVNRQQKRLKMRRGGLTFMELIVSMVIIAVASVAVAKSFGVAYTTLRWERNRLRANQLLKAEAEFWMGRVHSDFPTPYEMQNRIPHPDNPITLDTRGTATTRDDIGCDIFKEWIRPRDVGSTTVNPDWWEVLVSCTYFDTPMNKTLNRGRAPVPHKVEIFLTVPFIPSSL